MTVVKAETYWEPHWLPDRGPRERCMDCDKVVVGHTMEEAEARAQRIKDRTGRQMYAYTGTCGHLHLTRKLKKRKNVNA